MEDETYGVAGLNEGVVDGHDLNIVELDGVAEDDTTNAAESVDANLGDHFDCVLFWLFGRELEWMSGILVEDC